MKTPRRFAPAERHVIATYLFKRGWSESDIGKLLGASVNRVHKILRDPRFAATPSIQVLPTNSTGATK